MIALIKPVWYNATPLDRIIRSHSTQFRRKHLKPDNEALAAWDRQEIEVKHVP